MTNNYTKNNEFKAAHDLLIIWCKVTMLDSSLMIKLLKM